MGSGGGRAVVHKRKLGFAKTRQRAACVTEGAAEPSLNTKGAPFFSQTLCWVGVSAVGDSSGDGGNRHRKNSVLMRGLY